MTTLRTDLKRLLLDESGQDLVEYALAACLIACAAVVSIRSLASKVSSTFTYIGTSVTANT